MKERAEPAKSRIESNNSFADKTSKTSHNDGLSQRPPSYDLQLRTKKVSEITQDSESKTSSDHALQLKSQTGSETPPDYNLESNSAQENNVDPGLPIDLKSGIEGISGFSMDDVKVHYNSSKPAQLQAHAYAQGSDIHVSPGQEKHLPHEAWHVVQQKQGRVEPTTQLKGKVNVNDDVGLEKEADIMGEKSLNVVKNNSTSENTLQEKPLANSQSSLQKHDWKTNDAHVENEEGEHGTMPEGLFEDEQEEKQELQEDPQQEVLEEEKEEAPAVTLRSLRKKYPDLNWTMNDVAVGKLTKREEMKDAKRINRGKSRWRPLGGKTIKKKFGPNKGQKSKGLDKHLKKVHGIAHYKLGLPSLVKHKHKTHKEDPQKLKKMTIISEEYDKKYPKKAKKREALTAERAKEVNSKIARRAADRELLTSHMEKKKNVSTEDVKLAFAGDYDPGLTPGDVSDDSNAASFKAAQAFIDSISPELMQELKAETVVQTAQNPKVIDHLTNAMRQFAQSSKIPAMYEDLGDKATIGLSGNCMLVSPVFGYLLNRIHGGKETSTFMHGTMHASLKTNDDQHIDPTWRQWSSDPDTNNWNHDVKSDERTKLNPVKIFESEPSALEMTQAVADALAKLPKKEEN